MRRDWRLAAVLFVGGGLGAVPADAMHVPAQPPAIYLLPALALVSGAVCWLVAPRAAARWLHMMVAVATIEVAVSVWLADRVFAVYYVFIALYAAYVFQSRRAIALHVAFAAAAAMAPVIYAPSPDRAGWTQAMVLIPTLVLAAWAVTTLRERLEASERRYRELAYLDPLTGLGNYRLLTERLPQQLEAHRRHHLELSLVVVDLDDFKRVNDEGGHQFGDLVLRRVASVLSDAVRAGDLVVRQGGDEFSIVAPGCDRRRAEVLADRVCAALAGIVVKGHPIGGSAGLAVFPADASSANELIARADEALRAGKPVRPRPPRPATLQPLPEAPPAPERIAGPPLAGR